MLHVEILRRPAILFFSNVKIIRKFRIVPLFLRLIVIIRLVAVFIANVLGVEKVVVIEPRALRIVSRPLLKHGVFLHFWFLGLLGFFSEIILGVLYLCGTVF